MSEILARIRVRETHGIRRFLYPSMTTVELPEHSDSEGFQLIRPDSKDIPTEILSASNYQVKEGYKRFQIGFAISLAPHEEVELRLSRGSTESQLLDDPLNVQQTQEGGLENCQERFSVSLTKNGDISHVMYDGVSHLTSSDQICVNGLALPGDSQCALRVSPLSLSYFISTQYQRSVAEGGEWQDFLTTTGLTACKSWVKRYLWLQEPMPGDEITFTLPLAISSPTLTCDFGVGGYVFGKLDAAASEIVWRTEFGAAPYAKWTVATAGRVDYMGEVATAEEFRIQRWFHLIDSDKALAVAIAYLPEECQVMTVRLTHAGNISVAFKLDETLPNAAEFGVCYHFLNDVPAIAAATNPQSILLPPIIEVLPV